MSREEDEDKGGKKSIWKNLANQFLGLLNKNFLIFKQRWVLALLFIIILPLMISVLAVNIEFGSDSGLPQYDGFVFEPRIITCDEAFSDASIPAFRRDCKTIAFSPDTSEYIEVVENLCEASGLDCEHDVQAFNSSEEAYYEIASNMGTYLTYIRFFPSNDTEAESTFAPVYEINFNETVAYRFNRYVGLLPLDELSYFVDKALIRYMTNNEMDIEWTGSRFHASEYLSGLPETGADDYLEGAAYSSASVVHLTWVTCLLIAMLIMVLIIEEKNQLLVDHLRSFTVPQVLFWTSWIIPIFILGFVAAFLGVFSGYWSNVRVLEEAPILYVFFAFLGIIWSTSSLALFFASFIRRTILWIFVLVLFVLGFLMIQGMDYYDYDFEDTPFIVFFFVWFLPFRHFGTLMSRVSANGNNVEHLDQKFAFASLFCLPIVYFCLAVFTGRYLSNIFGIRHSIVRDSIDFFWGIKEKKDLFQSSKSADEDDDFLENLVCKSFNESSIITNKLSKVYKTTTALQEVSIEIKKGEIFCLLGENGAGKSTLINVLTCSTPITYGNAFVLGNDISSDIDNVHRLVSVCPQTNILWNRLSVKQNLMLICRLCYYNSEDSEKKVKEILQRFDFVQRSESIVQTLSGGMRRRLSVMAALVADSPVVFLDEPSTGLDPVSRSIIWKAIKSYKKERILVITTHSMEEAEKLGDNFCVLKDGKSVATGSSTQIKDTYGAGYVFSCVTSEENTNVVREQIGQIGRDLKFFGEGNVFSVSVPKSRFSNLQCLLSSLLKGKLLEEWGLSNNSLEEVFLRLSGSDDIVGNENAFICALCGQNPPSLVTLFTHDGMPVRLEGVICSQCSHEFVMPSPTFDNDVKVQFQEPDDEVDLVLPPNDSENSKSEAYGSRVLYKTSVFKQAIALSYKDFSRAAKYRKSIVCFVLVVIAILIILFALSVALLSLTSNGDSSQCFEIYSHHAQTFGCSDRTIRNWARWAAGDRWFMGVITCLIDGCLSYDYVDFTPSYYAEDTHSYGHFNLPPAVKNEMDVFLSVYYYNFTQPFGYEYFQDDITPFANISAYMDHIVQTYNLRSYYSRLFLNTPPGTFAVNAAFEFEDFSDESTVLRYSVSSFFDLTPTIGSDSHIFYSELRPVLSLIHNGILMSYDSTLARIQGFSSGMPVLYSNDWESEEVRQITLILSILLGMLLVSLLPGTSYFIATERSKGLLEMMRVQNLGIFAYFLGLTFFIGTVTLFFSIIVFLLVFGFGFTQGGVLYVYALLLIFVWAYTLSAFTISISFYFPYPKILLTSLALLVPGMAFFVFNGSFQISEVIFLFVPPLSLSRCIHAFLSEGFSPILSIIYLFLSGSLFWGFNIIILAYEARVEIREKVVTWYELKRKNKTKKSEEHLSIAVEMGSLASSSADNLPINTNAPLSLRNIKKDFRLHHGYRNEVLKGISFDFPIGCIFGLLGANGAGKTTMLRIISGQIEATEGLCYVCGADSSKQKNRARRHIGICPQDDVLFDELTVEEHLKFYGMLRGVPRRKLKKVAYKYARKCHLDGNPYRQPARGLSGGQKRSLSIANALIGDAPVLLLDEPTTGIDPLARRRIWDVIRGEMNHGRCIILTSHSMDEVENLCTKLTIMRDGEFSVTGSPLEIKRLYGRGYVLRGSLNLNPLEDEDECKDRLQTRIVKFLKEHGVISPCVIPRSGNSFHVELGKTMPMKLFEDVQVNRVFLSIRDWILSQGSLDDAFRQVVGEDKE